MHPDDQIAYLTKGAAEVISLDELARKLERSHKTKTPLNIKAGFDPTAADLHLGHTVLIYKLKHFQSMGHNVQFLIGDFTALIGDPSGRNSARPPLTAEQVRQNAATYTRQVFKILDPQKTRVVFNNEWMGKMSAGDLIKLSSHYTVARMLERNDFSDRMAQQKPLSIHEFLYPLVQGYDSVVLKSDVELGGNDQKFNLLVGRELQRDFGQAPQVIMTMPLLEGTDGKEKMSKSLANYIGIEEPAETMFAKIMSIPDELMIKYYALLTDYTPSQIGKIEQGLKAGALHPRQVKKELGINIVAGYYGQIEAESAAQQFEKIHQDKEIPDEIPCKNFQLEEGQDKAWIVRIITGTVKIAGSSQVRRLIQQGGVKVNHATVSDVNLELPPGEYIIQIGRREFVKVSVV
ncbi:MAG: tyrosine--tRNA ligase [Candidatus Schekmanbacteria bacterium]|nr:tyrosine--tRNA ligase [Candidatus Schekmanbacteria bacterium]